MTSKKQEGKPEIKLSSYAEGLLMMYDLASKEAGVENAAHKTAFTRIVLQVDSFTAMAEILTRMQLIEREAKVVAGIGSALFK